MLKMFSSSITLFFILHIVMTPIYVFPSGMPQPGDFLIPIGVAALFMAGGKIRFPTPLSQSFFFATVAFFLWVCIVSFVNALVANLADILYAAVYGSFNCMLVVLGFGSTQNRRVDYNELIGKALFWSTILMFFGFLVNFTGNFRQTAMFNNPNQLAYFSILTLGGLILVTDRSGLLRLRFMIPATMLIISNLAAASLTGYAAIGLLLGAWAIKVEVRRLFLIVLVVLIGAFLAPRSLIEIGDNDILSIVSNRFFLIGDKLDGGLAERGYERILNFPHYLVFGAGEGGLSRFGIDGALELHSTFGTILFSYGVVGLFLFLNIIRFAIRGATFVEILVLLAPLAYSLTHHGFRFSTFWVFLVIFMVVKENRVARNAICTQSPEYFRPRAKPIVGER